MAGEPQSTPTSITQPRHPKLIRQMYLLEGNRLEPIANILSTDLADDQQTDKNCPEYLRLYRHTLLNESCRERPLRRSVNLVSTFARSHRNGPEPAPYRCISVNYPCRGNRAIEILCVRATTRATKNAAERRASRRGVSFEIMEFCRLACRKVKSLKRSFLLARPDAVWLGPGLRFAGCVPWSRRVPRRLLSKSAVPSRDRGQTGRR
jgi:hypothetical protein